MYRVITVRLKIFSPPPKKKVLVHDGLSRNGVKDFVERDFPYCKAACYRHI